MTSDTLKASLRMMADFAPALMHAQEILESVEKAEGLLVTMDARKQTIVNETAGLEEVRAARAAESVTISAEVEKAKADAQVEKAKLNKSLGVIQGKVEAAQEALAATQREHANFLQQTDAARTLKQSELDGVQRELDALLAKLRH